MLKRLKAANWTYLIVSGIVRVYMLGALTISFGHIVAASHLLQLNGWQAYTVPFAVDGFAVLGMIGRSHRFAATTRKTGFKLQAAAGVLSLGANVYAGHTIGERLYGGLIVAAFVVAEAYAGKLAPAPAAKPVSADRSAAARKAAETRRARAEAAQADAAAKAEADKQRKENAATRRRARTAAPVSPAPAGPIAPGIFIPSPQDIARLVGAVA